MIYIVHKVFNGCVDVPDYRVNEHIQAKKTLRIVFGGQFMDLSPKQLKKPEIKSEPFPSKYNPGQTYRLYSYRWKPQKVEEFNSRTIKYQYKI